MKMGFARNTMFLRSGISVFRRVRIFILMFWAGNRILCVKRGFDLRITRDEVLEKRNAKFVIFNILFTSYFFISPFQQYRYIANIRNTY